MSGRYKVVCPDCGDVCPYCGSASHVTGYGLAAGPLGSYTFCNGCDELIEFTADVDGVSDDHIARLQSMQDDLAKKLDAARAALKEGK